MPLAPSSLSRACRSVAEFLSAGLAPDGATVQVLVGTPAAAAGLSGDPAHRINLFFYRVAPDGFDSQSLPAEPWRVRLHCLITPFGIDEQGVSAGENDLRILGEVIRLLHERPVLPEVGVNGESARLHAVFEPLDLDSLNRLWTTQGEISLRPSVSYEIALVPIVPSTPSVGGPLVGSVGLGVRPDIDDLAATPAPARTPEVPLVRVNTRRADWTPHICFVEAGACSYALDFAVGSPELAAFTPRVWVAGAATETVQLTWQERDPRTGWSAGPETSVPAVGDTIDPTVAASASLARVALPWTDHPGQFTLFATRSWTRPEGAQVVLTSNPLLVTLHPAGG